MPDPVGPELVIGLIGAVGADLDAVSRSLRRALDAVTYRICDIRLIKQALRLPRWNQPESPQRDVRYHRRMTVGNEFRDELKHEDAFALAGAAAIQAERVSYWQENGAADPINKLVSRPIPRCAFVLRSLKTPQEVQTLRRIYGDNALVLAAYAPRTERKAALAATIAASYADTDTTRYEARADELIRRDEREHGRVYGQNLRDTFPLADFFLDARRADESAGRFVELLFGHPVRTPTRAECAMFQAYGAALRSASPGRQVGAAIATLDGEIVSVGTNEVAKAFGGQYWAEDGDERDHRDHKRHIDASDALMSAILKDLLERLKRAAWLSPEKAAQDTGSLLAEAKGKLLDAFETVQGDPVSLGEKAQLANLIEFMRAVHAEMAALTSAARRGVPVQGCVLYSTAFPCHECARLIVAAGISCVVFIEPYPKSRAGELYDDSIAVDCDDTKRVPFKAFVGTSPLRYRDFFTMPERKTKDGEWVDWDAVRQERQPRIGGSAVGYREAEVEWVELYGKLLTAHGLGPTTTVS